MYQRHAFAQHINNCIVSHAMEPVYFAKCILTRNHATSVRAFTTVMYATYAMVVSHHA